MKARPSLIQKHAWHVPAAPANAFSYAPSKADTMRKKLLLHMAFMQFVALAAKFHSKRYVHPWNPYAAHAPRR